MLELSDEDMKLMIKPMTTKAKSWNEMRQSYLAALLLLSSFINKIFYVKPIFTPYIYLLGLNLELYNRLPRHQKPLQQETDVSDYYLSENRIYLKVVRDIETA